MKALFLAGFLALLGSAGCGGKTSYNYEFSGTGCDTGKQVFSTLSLMCASLQSASANDNDCALAARQTFFMNECPGTFQDSP